MDAARRAPALPRQPQRPLFYLALSLALLLLLLHLPSLAQTSLAQALAPPPPPPQPLLASLCSHQGRLAAGARHGPTTAAELLPALSALLARGVACFALDLRPLPGGGAAVGHPAALAAAPPPPGAALDAAALLAFLAGAPAARVTLELKAPLGSDGALVAALAEAARAAGVLPRLAVLGLSPAAAAAAAPAGLQLALPIRDDRDCGLEGLGARGTAVVLPSRVCWSRPAVRAAVQAWAAALPAPPPADRPMLGEVHVWVVDEREQALALLAQAPHAVRLRLVSNDVSAVLAGQQQQQQQQQQ